MAHARWMSLPLVLGFATTLAAMAQSAATPGCTASPNAGRASAPVSRVSGEGRSSTPQLLPGSAPPRQQDSSDLGVTSGGTRLDRLILLLEPSAAQRQALDAELEAQQTPNSCDYHRWLTPQQFADRYSNSAADVTAVSDWLRSQGFTVAPPPGSRGWIEFSGTAEQVAQAFRSSVRAYSNANGLRFALAGPISVPAALAPVIRGLVSLDGSSAISAITKPQLISGSTSTPITDAARAEALTPALAARIMHFEDLPQAAGESIAIAARSNVQPADIAVFRSTFGLPANPLVVIPNGPDPGLTSDQAAVELAASWSGAVAPAARIVVVPSRTTAATDGIDLSLAAIVDRSLANTVVVGYSSCEAALSDAHRAFYAALYRQAAVQGMSTIAATGDRGAAACHAAGGESAVHTGYAVNALASTAWNTAVGAAAFASSGDSVLSAWGPVNSVDPAYASGGGRSRYYVLPAWQPALKTASPGRMLPDIALPTGLDSALSHGLAFCFSGADTPGGCTLVRSGGSAAAAAIFGGISAVIAGQNGPQGNLAPHLYALRNRNGIFTDVRIGSARLACAAGSPGCDASGTLGYDAAPGYDLATGLGVPNAVNLLAAWPDAGTTGSTVAMTVSPTQTNATYNPQATVTFTATVTGAGGTPTGSINFLDQNIGANLNSVPYTLDSTGAASISLVGAMPKGGNSIVAQYSGDNTYAAQTSQALNITIQQSSTTTTVTPATTTPKVGTAFNVTATLAVGSPPAGTASPTGNVTLTLDGANYATSAVTTTGGTTSASFSVTVNSSGNHNLQAIYAGDANYVTSTSTSVPVTAASSTVNVGLAVSPVQSSYNPSASMTFTAMVISQSGGATPTGTVNFLDQATGNNLNLSPVSLSSGKASVTVKGGLPNNSNGIVAEYSGDSNYPATNSQVLTVNIQPSSTTPTVTPSTTTPAVGAAFPVTVTIAVGTPPAGTASPTGKVTLTLDGASYATANLTTASGVTSASFNVSVSSSGGHNLQAIYAGDANYAPSTSDTVTVTASKGATVTTLTADPSTLSATPETLTATIAAASSPAGATNTFTGTVTFYDGTSQIGTANVSGATATLSNVTLSTTTTHNITAVYSGDGNWAGSTSNIVTLKAVLIPVTVTLAATPANAGPGQVVTLTATVTPTTAPASSAEQNPAGTITFYNGATILGTVTLSAAANNTATAQLLFTTLPAGQNKITAVYSGDLFYTAATSNVVTITVQDFAIVPSPDNPPADLDIDKGSSGTVSYTITGQGGFNGAIALACAVPSQDFMTCTPNVTSVTPNGTVTFTVTTFLTGSSGTSARNNRTPFWPRAAGGTAFAVLLFFLVPAGRRVRIYTDRGRRMLILLVLLGAVGATGMGCSSVSGSVQGTQGTPLGETTLTITGAANIDNTVYSHSVYLTVNVLAPGATGTSQPVQGAR